MKLYMHETEQPARREEPEEELEEFDPAESVRAPKP
jgi:hypothetical protein